MTGSPWAYLDIEMDRASATLLAAIVTKPQPLLFRDR